MEITTNTPIHHAIQMIKQFPLTNYLTVVYHRSSKKDLCYVGIASFCMYKISKYIKTDAKRLNEPPTVPFGLPIFGHGLYILFMPTLFLDWCSKKYGEVYSFYNYGKLITVANGKAGLEAIKAAETDLSFDHGALRGIFHLHYVFEPKIDNLIYKIFPSVAKVALAKIKSPDVIPCIENGISTARKELLGDDMNSINDPGSFFRKFISFIFVPILLGKEFSSNREVIDSFGNFASDVAKNIHIFLSVPVSLHRFILPYIHSPKRHIKTIETHIAPFVLERREQMRLAKESGIELEIEQTLLQGLIEFVDKDEDGNEFQYTENKISQAVLMIAFASVHNTSLHLSYCVYWLLARPDLKDKLMREIEDVAPGDTRIDTDILNKMNFLNNFLRESFRQGSEVMGHSRLAMQDYTFNNGYQIPKGRSVKAGSRQLNFGCNTTRSKINEMDPNMSGNKAVTTPDNNFTLFGLGKRLCPGRFLAVQEIKMVLIYLLRNFDINTANGKRPVPVQRFAGVKVTCSNEPLVFTVKNKINA